MHLLIVNFMQDRVSKENSSQIPDVEVENISSLDKNKKITTKNQRENGSNPSGWETSSCCLVTEETDSQRQSLKSALKSEPVFDTKLSNAKGTNPANKRNTCCVRENIDLECDTQENSR